MAGAREDNVDMSEFSFTAAIRGFHVYRRVWLPHLGQRLSAEREHGNVDDRFAIAVREHGGTRADEVRPIVVHLLREFSKVLYRQLSLFLHDRSNYSRTTHVQYLFTF